MGRVEEEERPVKRFDVICAGEALWKIAAPGKSGTFSPGSAGLRPGGGPVPVALALAREGLRVGLATVLADDTFGRGAVEKIAGSGVDVGAVSLARSRPGILRVDAGGGASPLSADVEAMPPLDVPRRWSCRVLLLSGLSPIVSHAAALCKAARAARRNGSFVLIDFNASLHVWAGRDARTIRMVLREVDAARCSLADLAVLGMDAATARAALRPSAVLVVGDGAGGAVATGPFGEVAFAPPRGVRLRDGAGDASVIALCAELLHPADPGESAGARWLRALQRGHAAAASARA